MVPEASDDGPGTVGGALGMMASRKTEKRPISAPQDLMPILDYFDVICDFGSS
jgi:hypothetical protein